MVPGDDGGDGERAIGLNGANGSLIDENRSSGHAALDGQRGQPSLGLRLRLWLRLEVEDKPGLFALANADLLLGRILKAAFGDLYNVVPGLEIWHAQLACLSELPLRLTVEKNSCIVLTSNDKERAQIVAGVCGRSTIGCNFSRSRVGRSAQGRQNCFGRGLCRRRWCGTCWYGVCLRGSCRCGDVRGRYGWCNRLGLR